MTNIKKIQSHYSVRLHTAKKIEALFNQFLRYGYTKQVIKVLKMDSNKNLQQRIRMVKDFRIKDPIIFEALLKVAKNNEAIAVAHSKQLEQITN